MHKHDRAYSAFEIRRKYVCVSEMQHDITREGILILYYSTINVLRILRTPPCSQDTLARRICFEIRTKHSNHWQEV